MTRLTNLRKEMLASAKWARADGELVVVSEAANPGIRDTLAEHSSLRSPGSGTANGSGVDRGRENLGSLDGSETVRGGSSAMRANITRVHDTPRFTVFAFEGSFVVVHRLGAGEVDNDVAETIAGELVRPGRLAIPNAFERCFAGVVSSSAPDPESAWRMFYANTLSKLERAASEPREDGDFSPTSVFGRIYDHARGLLVGSSVLDVGTCFGFFPMLLRRKNPHLAVTALDLSEPMISLAAKHAEDVSFERGDTLELPFDDGAFDTVVSLHVLEHLSPESASRAASEMRRVARKRVVLAVPLEKEPDPAYGHVRSFDHESLTKLAEADGWKCVFEEYLGGWVVLDAATLTTMRCVD